jgi:hypothetical protein
MKPSMNAANSNTMEKPNVASSLLINGRAMHDGWVLSGLLIPDPSPLQCRLALRMAYQSIRWTDAGLAMAPETNELLLMRWHSRLPSAEMMQRNTDQFRQGLELWREALVRSSSTKPAVAEAEQLPRGGPEHRMRQRILGLER